jgi:hypothetical protein
MHKWILRASGGRLFAKIGKLPVLLLFTRGGRKSGEVRMNALSYVPHGNAYAVVASNAGADFHPEARGDEKDEIFAEFEKAEPGYAEYKKRTKREIPVVVLEPKM